MRYVFYLCLIITQVTAQSKKEYVRPVQFSLAPAFGSNGFHPGSYINYISINLTSGYSSANYLLEISGISSLNVTETRGLQISGLTNITGGNAFATLSSKEREKKIKDGFEANLSGLQFSSIANVVLNNVFGGQFTGGFNFAGGGLQGIQIAGIGNTVSKYTFGIQLAGVWNISVASMDGIQIASLMNLTQNELFGIQLGLYNRAGVIQGKNSYDNHDPSGVQIGFFNKARTMNGFQIGIINWGKQMQGTQIGLINIYRGGKMPQTRDGTSIGFVNIGSSGYASVYSNELFLTNIEVATGTTKNGRMSGERSTREIQNGLIYGWNPGNIRRNNAWALGYGLKKMFLTRSTAPGYSNMNFLLGGLDILHYNHTSRLTRELSLIARPTVAVGSRFHPKNRTFSFFAAAAYNLYWSDSGLPVRTIVNQRSETVRKYFDHWPGFNVGVMIKG